MGVTVFQLGFIYKNWLTGWIWPSSYSLTTPDVLYVSKLRSGEGREKAFQTEERDTQMPCGSICSRKNTNQ